MAANINSQVQERLFLETNNSCAICGSKVQVSLTIHHINHEKSEKDNSYDNLIVLCHNCHTSYHQNKGITKEEILEIKKRLIHSLLTPIGINAVKLAYRNKFIIGMPYTLLHLLEMGLIKDEGDVESRRGFSAETGKSYEVIVKSEYTITEKGTNFAKKWGLN